jgi:uncharacterized protein YjbJ (UPF0337 family)
MGMFDKVRHKAEQLAGRGKEAAGAATDNDDLKNAGKRDQLSGEAKETAQDVKDKAAGAVQDAKDKLDGGNGQQSR